MRKKIIYWAGDSTVAFNDFSTYPQTGIGQGFSLFLKDEVMIKNYAVNGRSTKSFIDEGRLGVIEKEIEKNDFLFIQFSHNDEKKNEPTLYTHPFTSFKENLTKYITVAKDKGAYPVLITPLSRRLFKSNDRLEKKIHGDYPQAMKEVSEEQNVPIIDLFKKSMELILEVGKEKSNDFFMNIKPEEYMNYPNGMSDNTHLKYHGAVMFASIIAKGIFELGRPYSDVIKENSISKI